MNAKKILDLLKTAPSTAGYQTAESALFAWGASKFKGHDAADQYGSYSLAFDVTGTNFVGKVRIGAINDTEFNIFFEQLNNTTGARTSFMKLNNVKAAELIDAIDSVVEPQETELKALKDGAVAFNAKEWAENFISLLARNGNYLSEDLVQAWLEKTYQAGKNS